MDTNIHNSVRALSDFCWSFICLAVGGDDSADSDFEKSESSAESGMMEELSEPENSGKRPKTR